MQKITTFLTYDDQAEPAARLYVSIFEDQCRIVDTVKGPNDKVMTVTFDLFGVRHVALNAGPSPDFHFSNGVSLMVLCEDQAEVDRYWAKLTADGGSEIMCGWCKDRFGLPWQIVPRADGDDREQGPRGRRPGNAGDDEDEEAGSRHAPARFRRGMSGARARSAAALP
jgi:predicted 3-demethylubiquinone-9 3-methyltransferase (glyoxalase superfamily)